MTREQIENAIKCCNPYDEDCGSCPFKDLPLGRCFEMLAKTAFNMILEDREKLQKQVKEYKDKIEQGTLIELPCKVGDTVWELDLFSKQKVREIKARNMVQIFHWIEDESFGKYLFFTREESEQRLKELQE